MSINDIVLGFVAANTNNFSIQIELKGGDTILPSFTQLYVTQNPQPMVPSPDLVIYITYTTILPSPNTTYLISQVK